jgi:hypothetical protein
MRHGQWPRTMWVLELGVAVGGVGRCLAGLVHDQYVGVRFVSHSVADIAAEHA